MRINEQPSLELYWTMVFRGRYSPRIIGFTSDSERTKMEWNEFAPPLTLWEGPEFLRFFKAKFGDVIGMCFEIRKATFCVCTYTGGYWPLGHGTDHQFLQKNWKLGTINFMPEIITFCDPGNIMKYMSSFLIAISLWFWDVLGSPCTLQLIQDHLRNS